MRPEEDRSDLEAPGSNGKIISVRFITKETGMNKPKNKSILVLTIFAIILCGCPGLTLFLMGLASMTDAISGADSISDMLTGLNSNFLRGGWLVCLGGVLLLVPLVLVILVFVQRRKKTPITALEPTGASEEDPIPPTR